MLMTKCFNVLTTDLIKTRALPSQREPEQLRQARSSVKAKDKDYETRRQKPCRAQKGGSTKLTKTTSSIKRKWRLTKPQRQETTSSTELKGLRPSQDLGKGSDSLGASLAER